MSTIIGVMVPGFKQHTGVNMSHAQQQNILEVIRDALLTIAALAKSSGVA